MQAKVDLLRVSAGGTFERDFIGECEIIVMREGHSRARHRFMVCGETLARLRWRGLRRAVYETEGLKYELYIGALEKRIALIAEDGAESFLVERSRSSPRREELRVEMAEGDNFCLSRSWDSRFRAEASLTVHKQFYKSTLMVFRFNVARRTQTTVRVSVHQALKWEARFVHRLLALIVCRIILERRRSGSQPLRAKEKPRGFTRSASVRERKRPG